MASIKGPRSALTDFIEENKIKINTQTVKSKIEEIKNDSRSVKPKNKKIKGVKKQMPVEVINLETLNETDQDLYVKDVLNNINNISLLTSEQLYNISSYLSRKRIHNNELYKYILQKSTETLVIHDCSEIKNEEYLIQPNLISLELYQCGQLSSVTINNILRTQTNLKTLKLTGGYLLTELDLPSSLKILDLSHCSRLSDAIFDEINNKFTELEELKLSYCYKITGNVKLTIPVKRLFLCETNVSEEFIQSVPNIKQITHLSVKMCKNVDNLNIKFTKLEFINVEGLTELENLHLPKTVSYLNCKQCFNFIPQLEKYFKKLTNLKELNISYLPFDVSALACLTNLNLLDISWCPEVTDSTIIELRKNLNLSELYVFGCFNLTPSISACSWEKGSPIKVLGNPAETKYLILNNL